MFFISEIEDSLFAISTDCEWFDFRNNIADIWLSILFTLIMGWMLFITPMLFIFSKRDSTVGVLTLISLAICLKDFLPSCIRELIIAKSILSTQYPTQPTLF